jgi:hypothetical protein
MPALRNSAAEKLNFSFQVRPILADHCFKCHGPDEKARKGKLRLDLPETAYAIRQPDKQEAAIVPFHPERSQLCWRISATNEDDRMPPPASNLSLNEAERSLLQRWVAEGAQYTPHWAFIPVGTVPVPDVAVNLRAAHDGRPQGAQTASTTQKGAALLRDSQRELQPAKPVDRFIQSRLAREGLRPSPEASRETLIRRLSLDLRGLPPSLEEINEFLADKSPAAYERLVERFLASPAYGEQQAAQWLDLARFADTYGYQSDVERDMSPWRDWVIRAFNQNLPYDQFITWQLGGDLLPAPTRDQLVATAFNRLHRQTNEGGSIEEEFRAEYVADRVATAGTAFLGLTLGCARCHDHKYDPVSQKDFYRLSAFFNNCDESGLYSHFTRATPSPTLLLYRDGEEARHQALQQQLQQAEAALPALAATAAERFDAWLRTESNAIPTPQPAAAFAFEEIVSDKTPDSLHTNRFAVLLDGPELADGKVGRALKFSGDNSAVCKGVGDFNRTSPFTFSLWLKPTEPQPRAVVLHRSRAWTDSGSRGYELVLDEGRPAFSLIHFWPGNALQVRAQASLPLGVWSHLAITYDGRSRATGLRLFLNGEPMPAEVVRDHLFKDILHRDQWGDMEANSIELTLAARFRDSGFKNGLMDEFQIFDRCLTPWEVKLAANLATGRPGRDALLAWYLDQVDAPYRAAQAELRKLREAENALISDVPEIMVMSEMAPRRPAYVLKRGAYDTPGERVEAGVPERIAPFPPTLPRTRLGLAQWMIARENPLTARVAVNRIWRSHFGRGLVKTEEDFGTQGKLPTHPELLDWLARTFMDSGWDVKALHRLLVSSATYRQSSQADAGLLAKDPENRLLARGPKHRLRAEEIRDNALAISGLLSPRLGGPSARPYQPEGLWEQAGTGKEYHRDEGEGLYRRSLYTFWKRTAPPPSMLIFDAPTREVCIARRETTTTPLQALVLLNDPQFVEAARVLAERLLRQCGQDVNRGVTTGFRLATGRAPAPAELALLHRLYQEQLDSFAAQPDAAAHYLKTGEQPADTSLPPRQLAAMAVVASALMNLDEFVTER